jgi:hypothetical protein
LGEIVESHQGIGCKPNVLPIFLALTYCENLLKGIPLLATFSSSSLSKREADFKENSSKTGELIYVVGFNNFKATK